MEIIRRGKYSHKKSIKYEDSFKQKLDEYDIGKKEFFKLNYEEVSLEEFIDDNQKLNNKDFKLKYNNAILDVTIDDENLKIMFLTNLSIGKPYKIKTEIVEYKRYYIDFKIVKIIYEKNKFSDDMKINKVYKLKEDVIFKKLYNQLKGINKDELNQEYFSSSWIKTSNGKFYYDFLKFNNISQVYEVMASVGIKEFYLLNKNYGFISLVEQVEDKGKIKYKKYNRDVKEGIRTEKQLLREKASILIPYRIGIPNTIKENVDDSLYKTFYQNNSGIGYSDFNVYLNKKVFYFYSGGLFNLSGKGKQYIEVIYKDNPYSSMHYYDDNKNNCISYRYASPNRLNHYKGKILSKDSSLHSPIFNSEDRRYLLVKDYSPLRLVNVPKRLINSTEANNLERLEGNIIRSFNHYIPNRLDDLILFGEVETDDLNEIGLKDIDFSLDLLGEELLDYSNNIIITYEML